MPRNLLRHASTFAITKTQNYCPMNDLEKESDKIMETSLSRFLASERVLLNKFEKHWREQNRIAPRFYPIEMKLGDWDKQLLFFGSNERKEIGDVPEQQTEQTVNLPPLTGYG